MPTHKKFFIYFLLTVLFFIYSQLMIYIGINTTYKTKEIELKTQIPMKVEVKATSVNGIAKGKIYNNLNNAIENHYIKIDCYSKHDVLMGTKYIKIDKLNANEEMEFEVRFNYSKVDKAVIDVISKEALEDNGISQEQLKSDPKRGLVALAVAVILLHFI